MGDEIGAVVVGAADPAVLGTIDTPGVGMGVGVILGDEIGAAVVGAADPAVLGNIEKDEIGAEVEAATAGVGIIVGDEVGAVVIAGMLVGIPAETLA